MNADNLDSSGLSPDQAQAARWLGERLVNPHEKSAAEVVAEANQRNPPTPFGSWVRDIARSGIAPRI